MRASLDRAADLAGRRRDSPHAAALGLRLSGVDRPTGMLPQTYPPSLSLALRGRKRSIIGAHDAIWGRERFLVTPVDLPVVAGVVEAPDGDFRSVMWRLDPLVIAEVAPLVATSTSSGTIAAGAGGATRSTGAGGAGEAAAADPAAGRSTPDRLGTWTPELADAVARLLGLLDRPEDIPVLAPLLAREVVLRLLQSDQAPRILAAGSTPDADTVSRAVALIVDELARPWSLDELAARVGVSASTLGRRFATVTGMSPLQYQKRSRLGEARRRMIVRGETAAEAAAAVGYRSASHFSRDYRAAYREAPGRDAVRARELLAAVPRDGLDAADWAGLSTA
ncbi:AraC family transcriptional regulator [Schumannella soli]|uniref:AraC family transcriptional regulator n=1 Tax=Schumannella soli TaxID=2590779 RepID=A0A506XXG2_9MICO|nr:AraC family transcriptional regulator [Schumannella soli]